MRVTKFMNRNDRYFVHATLVYYIDTIVRNESTTIITQNGSRSKTDGVDSSLSVFYTVLSRLFGFFFFSIIQITFGLPPCYDLLTTQRNALFDRSKGYIAYKRTKEIMEPTKSPHANQIESQWRGKKNSSTRIAQKIEFSGIAVDF
jgi:hypothetical protein